MKNKEYAYLCERITDANQFIVMDKSMAESWMNLSEDNYFTEIEILYEF